jgi:predicted nucleic acid-binding protein
MKLGDVLKGYMVHNEESIKSIWASAAFCLDTNVLLDIYRYTDENRMSFLKLLSAIKGRVFIPNRVAVEFARNRVTVIRGHFGPQRIIKSRLDDAAKDIRDKHSKHPLLNELVALVESAKKLVDDTYGVAEKKQMALIGNDTILPQLVAAIGDDVGEPYPDAEVQKEYKRRKDSMIPPFCKMDDDKDEERRTGDVVIWLELLKKYEGTKKPVIFVTDDMKENWWQNSGGRHDPHPILVQEAYTRTQSDILFYTSERFNETAPARLGVAVPKELVEQTKQIRDQERELERAAIRPPRIGPSRIRPRLIQPRLIKPRLIQPSLLDQRWRVYSLARELGMESNDLLELCQKASIPDVINSLSSIDPEQTEKIVELVRGGQKT